MGEEVTALRFGVEKVLTLFDQRHCRAAEPCKGDKVNKLGAEAPKRLKTSSVFCAALFLGLGAQTASAGVVYVTDLQFTPYGSIMQSAVYDANESPNGIGSTHLFEQQNEYWNVAPDASAEAVPFPAGLKTDASSVAARADLTAYFTNIHLQVEEYSFDTGQFDGSIDIWPIVPYSIATRGSRQVSVIGRTLDSTTLAGYLVDFATNTTTAAFSLEGDDQAFYQNYAPNGLLDILDYGNRRMLMLDPADGFAQTGEFPLNANVTTANESFGIGANGNFYLGDGLGGGSEYSSTGTFLGTFGLPLDFTPRTPFAGAAQVFAEPDGFIYVVDPSNGTIHKYEDVADAPEPSIVGLMVLGLGLVGRTVSRRRQIAHGEAPTRS